MKNYLSLISEVCTESTAILMVLSCSSPCRVLLKWADAQTDLSLCWIHNHCYDIKPVRMKEGKFYWKTPLCVDNATREKIMHTTSNNYSVLYVLKNMDITLMLQRHHLRYYFWLVDHPLLKQVSTLR